MTKAESESRETATLAGGCFWCLEAVFRDLAGVEEVVSGYIGGTVPDPTYEVVCSGRSGHAEAVRVRFDPAVLPYRDLLELFFAFHDPTTLNRQGPDRGTQYRSAIFPESRAQEATAREVIAKLEAEGVFSDPIVTTIEKFSYFYPAESHHQDYYARHSDQAYCVYQIGPKVSKLRSQYRHRLKSPA